jgi:hypothetical protein
MNTYATKAVAAAVELFSADTGLKVSLDQVQANRNQAIRLVNARIGTVNVGRKANEQLEASRVPTLVFSISQLSAKKRERLGKNNAAAKMTCVVQMTHEKSDILHQNTYDYVDAIVDVLNRSQGLWQEGIFFAGDYCATINAIQAGALNYLQTAIIEFDLTLWEG